MKKWRCDACHCEIEVDDTYESQYCCNGRMDDACACMGKPINPIFCNECTKIFNKDSIYYGDEENSIYSDVGKKRL